MQVREMGLLNWISGCSNKWLKIKWEYITLPIEIPEMMTELLRSQLHSLCLMSKAPSQADELKNNQTKH